MSRSSARSAGWRGWIACSVLLAAVAGCGSGSGSLDAGVGDVGQEQFLDADSLSCMQLDALWHSSQDSILMHLRDCRVDRDCALVSTSLDCRPLSGSYVDISGCDTSVATRHVSDWDLAVSSLAAQLCAERTTECVSYSRCPMTLTAACVRGVCTARSVPEGR